MSMAANGKDEYSWAMDWNDFDISSLSVLNAFLLVAKFSST